MVGQDSIMKGRGFVERVQHGWRWGVAMFVASLLPVYWGVIVLTSGSSAPGYDFVGYVAYTMGALMCALLPALFLAWWNGG